MEVGAERVLLCVISSVSVYYLWLSPSGEYAPVFAGTAVLSALLVLAGEES